MEQDAQRRQVLEDIEAVLTDAAKTHPAFAQMTREGVLARLLAENRTTEELREWLGEVHKAIAAMRGEGR